MINANLRAYTRLCCYLLSVLVLTIVFIHLSCTVANENTESWVHFIEKLYKQIGCDDGEGLYFMSDRQKRILNAFERVFPTSLNMYYCKHNYANFKGKFLFYYKSSNAVEFKNHTAKLYSIIFATKIWLLQILVMRWAKHKFILI